MADGKQKKKSCDNCKYFYQHYGWCATQFLPLNCGHCCKRNINKKDFARFPYINGCEQWEPNDIKKTEREEAIKNTLKAMAKRIEVIATFLEHNNAGK